MQRAKVSNSSQNCSKFPNVSLNSRGSFSQIWHASFIARCSPQPTWFNFSTAPVLQQAVREFIFPSLNCCHFSCWQQKYHPENRPWEKKRPAENSFAPIPNVGRGKKQNNARCYFRGLEKWWKMKIFNLDGLNIYDCAGWLGTPTPRRFDIWGLNFGKIFWWRLVFLWQFAFSSFYFKQI